MARTKKNLKRTIVNEIQANEIGESGAIPESFDEGIGEGSTHRNKRGRTIMRNVWKLPNSERIAIRANRYGQPIGLGTSNFTNFCGVIARNPQICPLSYPSWRHVPITTKGTAFAAIKQHFSYPDVIQKWVNKSLGKKWKDFKSYLKGKYYYPENSELENARNVPPTVTAQDWQYLVNYWKSDKGKKRAEMNRRSRARQNCNHTTGSKSFAVLLDELEVANGGEQIGDIDFYRTTHLQRSGTFVDDEAAYIMKKAEDLHLEKLETSQVDSLAIQREIMTEVRGKDRCGWVRGLGFGPTPSQVGNPYLSTSTNSNNELLELRAEVRELRELVAVLINQHKQTQAAPLHTPVPQ